MFQRGNSKKPPPKNVDPEIVQLMERCKIELEKLQSEKEAAIDDFLETHTEQRLMTLKM